MVLHLMNHISKQFLKIKRTRVQYYFQVFLLRECVTWNHDVTALTHQQLSHFKHKCGGRHDVLVRDQCPVVTGWMGHNIAPCEQAGLLFKSSGQSPSMCTSLLGHGGQRDGCIEPLLAYCRAGLLRSPRLANQIWNHHICEAYRQGCMQNKFKETRRLQHPSYSSSTTLKYHHYKTLQNMNKWLKCSSVIPIRMKLSGYTVVILWIDVQNQYLHQPETTENSDL